MQNDSNISTISENGKTLKDFIPLVFSFFGCLVVWSLYQNIRLYLSGALDGFLNKSFFLLVMHHTGFSAILALFAAFLFNFLERRKPDLGLKTTRIVFLAFLILEGFLVEYYVQNYEILGYGIVSTLRSDSSHFSLFPLALTLPLIVASFHYLGKRFVSVYGPISKMYPFTIILFSIFLATLNSDKKPINENKAQHLIVSLAKTTLDFNTYEGEKEYPLLRPYVQKDDLNPYFDLRKEKPHIVFLIVEGLGSDFVGKNAIYPGFTPFLDSIQNKALVWENFVSNTGEGAAALSSIIGSLPFGDAGFTNEDGFVHRHTLFGILKNNGYTTSFNYGGNSALNRFDRFLDEERVDRILDKNNFGDEYILQDEDAAGISLGYPDKELFKRGQSLLNSFSGPRMDVFLTLSTKSPYLVPNREYYWNKVDHILKESSIGRRERKLVRNHKEIFASLNYADEAIEAFITHYRKTQEYTNTIFIITGTHNLTDLPQKDELSRYRVPLMIFSPLINSPKRIGSLASHMDIMPSLVSLLDREYKLKIPQQVAWLGENLLSPDAFDEAKRIPLFRGKNNIQDFINGSYYLTDNSIYRMDKNLSLKEFDDDTMEKQVKDNFGYFKSVNKYVLKSNRIIPGDATIFASLQTDFSKQDMVWIQSVFNGKDFDRAYATARNLAHDRDWDRALLLCRYILKEIPRHADTEILTGRIHAWQKDYIKSIAVLQEAIRKYPTYADGYAALLDTYFWSGQHQKAIDLSKRIRQNGIASDEVENKILRARKKLKSETAKKDVDLNENATVETTFTEN
ncbi:sulfatase-like hydrolase/transferase [Ulvibacterium sp.]|uniref:sulfatase-like hydrolase/transferase n=1 Tax=Ulvibacterium sp. TaxID=2665914 RepID=UPI003BAA6CF5